METIIKIYLTLMFIALYMFFFFVILVFKNKKKLFFSPSLTNYPHVTILIPAYNEELSIGDTISYVSNLEYPKNKLEIIVINDGSKDKTKDVILKNISKYKNVKILDKNNTGKADSLNQGIKIAKGEFIAVVDSDSFPSKDSLKKIIGFFDDPQMAAVTSFVNIRNVEDNFLTRIQSIEYVLMGWARKVLDFVDSVYVTNGPLSVYRKDYILKVEGFDPKSITEDIDITWNMLSHDYKTAMCLDARVSTIAPSNFKDWFKQRTRWGMGGLQAIFKYKKLFFKRGMFGAFVLPFVSFSIILSLFGFFFSIYLLMKSSIITSFTIFYSVKINAPFINSYNLIFYPSVILFYTLILFISSVGYYNYILIKTGHLDKFSYKKFFNMCFYVLLYLMVYPIVWIASINRYILNDMEW